MNSDKTIISALAGDDPKKMLEEWTLRHITELEEELTETKLIIAELTERVEVLEDYQEPMRQIQGQ